MKEYVLSFMALLLGGSPDQSNVVMPLETGNRWLYQLINYDSSGVVQRIDIVGWRVKGDTEVHGEKWYFMSGTTGGMWANRQDGIWYWLSQPASSSVPILFAKHPAVVGDVWTGEIGHDSISIELVARDTDIAVPLGPFRCNRYEYKLKSNGMSRLLATKYYCIGIGLVRDDSYSRTPSGGCYLSKRRDLQGLIIKGKYPKFHPADSIFPDEEIFKP